MRTCKVSREICKALAGPAGRAAEVTLDLRGPEQLAPALSTDLDFGLGTLEPCLLFLTTACGHTRAAFQLAMAWDATPSHLAIWKGFSSSLLLLECFHDPQAWKHLLTTSP